MNLGPLRSHLLVFQALIIINCKNWPGSRQVCQTCSTAHAGIYNQGTTRNANVQLHL